MAYFLMIILLFLNILLQIAENPHTLINDDSLLERVKKLEERMEKTSESAMSIGQKVSILENDFEHNALDIQVIKWLSITSLVVLIVIILIICYTFIKIRLQGGFINVSYT